MSDLATVRADVADWLARAWDPGLTLSVWRERLVDSGWGRPTWPVPWYGRALAPSADAAVRAELRAVGAVGLSPGHGAELVAPTLLRHGSDALKRRLLRPALTGEHIWCQLFSEPGAGSDLAGLSVRADRDGDGWVVSGQKVWSSGAHHAHRGLLLARTDRHAPKRQGISCFALDMRQPGIEVRPIRQMNGWSSFNEVFLSGVRVEADDLVGPLDGGWPVALTCLAHERRLSGALSSQARARGDGRVVREARDEAREALAPYGWYRERAGRPDLVVDAARRRGRNGDPAVRQAIARLHTLVRTASWTAERARAARVAQGVAGPEGSLGKLHGSQIARCAAAVHSLIAGAQATVVDREAPLGALAADVVLAVPAASIAGGTDEIQRDILAQRILGLPKDPWQD